MNSNRKGLNDSTSAAIINNGNNIDNFWAGLDGEVLDADGNPVLLHSKQAFIDNNDEIDPSIYGENVQTFIGERTKNAGVNDTITEPSFEDSSIQVNQYILMIFGEPVSIGSKNKVEKDIHLILRNMHPTFKLTKIKLDDLVVLKRVEIRSGVFINE